MFPLLILFTFFRFLFDLLDSEVKKTLSLDLFFFLLFPFFFRCEQVKSQKHSWGKIVQSKQFTKQRKKAEEGKRIGVSCRFVSLLSYLIKEGRNKKTASQAEG